MKVLRLDFDLSQRRRFIILFEDEQDYKNCIEKYNERIKKVTKIELDEFNGWVNKTYSYNPEYKGDNIIANITMLNHYEYDNNYLENGCVPSPGKNLIFDELFDNYDEHGFHNRNNEHIDKHIAGEKLR